MKLAACGRFLWFLAVVSGGASCSGPESPKNLLLVTLDTTRADRLGAYGGPADGTPRLDALAREGALFETAFAPVPYTLPSHTTILSGLEPPSHGIHGNGQVLPPDVPSIAQALAAAGFATGAVLASSVLESSTGLDRGFASYDAPTTKEPDRQSRTGEEVTRLAVEWLRGRAREERFFLWVHYFDPHDPYEAPAPFGERFRDRPYDGEIAYADACLGSLLDHLQDTGRLDSTLVCIAGDHGESLGEHGEETHGVFVYDATMRVPLLLSHPRTVPPRRVEGVARLVDVAPTLLAALGERSGIRFEGTSLLPSIESGRIEPIRPAYLESEVLVPFGGAPLHAIRTREWKFIRAPRPELYRVLEDPGEGRNLFEAEPPVAARLDGELRSVEQGFAARRTAEPGDPEAARALAALGYARLPLPEASLLGLDPKDYFPLLETVDRALALLYEGRGDDAAIARIDAEFAGEIERTSARFCVAGNLWARSDLEGADRWIRRVVRARPDFGAARVLAATIAAARGRTALAEEELRETLRRLPDCTDAKLALGSLLLHLDRPGEAEPLLREATRERPNAFLAWEALGQLLAAVPERRAEAIEALERAVRFSPRPEASAALLERLRAEGRAASPEGRTRDG